MRCPSCGFENPNGSIFCQQCGSRFQQAAAATVVCSRCHAVQPANLRFCTTCGNTLGSPQPAQAPAQPAQQAPAFGAAPAAGGFGAQPAAQPAPSFGTPAAMPAPTLVTQPTPAVPPQAYPAPPAFAPPAQGSPMGRLGELAEKAAGPVCWRCRGQGEPGHEFCKFCGARYADAPAAPGVQHAPAPAVQQPAAAPRPQQPHAAQPAFGGAAAAPAPAAYAAAPAAAPAPSLAAARLVSILKDGTDGQSFPIQAEQFDIGRSEGEVTLVDDPYLSPRHARVRRQGDQFFLRDLDSVNGIYLRLRDSVELSHGDMVLAGQQVLRLEVLDDVESPFGPAGVHGVLVFGTPESPRAARLMQYTTEGLVRDVFYLYRNETVIGRESGDIVFTDDPFLSRRHASVRFDRAARKFTLADSGSSNGTFVRIRGERALAHQDQFRVGRHLFRFELASAMQGQGGR